jgi:hypothetical protein
MDNLKTLFEQLSELIDKPHEYNHVISKILSQVSPIDVRWYNGNPYIKDPLRDKMLSLARPTVTASYYGQNQSSRYLKLGVNAMSHTGFLVPRDATITAVWAKSRNSVPWALEVRKNDIPSPIFTLTMPDGKGVSDQVDVDVSAGDYVQLFLNGESVDHPLAFFEIAWRMVE